LDITLLTDINSQVNVGPYQYHLDFYYQTQNLQDLLTKFPHASEFAIAKYQALIAAGADATKLKLSSYRQTISSPPTFVLLATLDDGFDYVLDHTQNVVHKKDDLTYIWRQ
jgi:predicted transglutaminase-like cysteine proteinase